ncbi:MAG: hypothetical protein O3A51_08590, partial [Verrucomicrobia bacterium]|nr:hypothetical protein [Verrucomicrobiota bacterium]
VLLPTHIVAVWIRRRDGPYLCFAALSWLALMLTGQAYWLRYSLYFFMLSVVPLAVVLDNLRRWRGGLLFALAMLATLMMVKGGLVVGPRETMLTDWRPYLACQNRWERIAFISRHPTADTGRAIHVDHLGRDVVYSDIYKKLLFWDARFANRVEAIHYASADALRHWLREQQLDQPVIAVTRGSNEARWLASSQHFTTVYTNEHELLFRPTLQTASSPDRP